MRQTITSLTAALCVLAAVSCDKEAGTGAKPGIWTESDVIETYGGATVTLTGQASDDGGLRSIEISCADWGISKTYDLISQKPKVFNFDYQFAVPADASFDSELTVTVLDGAKNESSKKVALQFLPDTSAPTLAEDISGDISVDFDTEASKAIWAVALTVNDDRALKSYSIDIDSNDTHVGGELSGTEAQISKNIEFSAIGTFPMKLTVEDASGNKTVRECNVIVMLKEDEDPISNYDQMYIYDAEKSESDYVYGYYRYMDKDGDYCYKCKIYAEKDGAQFYFVPTESQTGDKFGVSPYVNTKLMNKNGYVKPYVVEKAGYYYVWIDIKNHKVSFTEYPVEDTIYKGTLVVSGTGFSDMADWTFSSEMSPAGTDYRKSIELSLNTSATDFSYCVTDGTSSWAKVWRMSDGKWWWLDDAWYGGSCASFRPGTASRVLITFDTAELWSTMKIIE
jgi:hypothetical protein